MILLNKKKGITLTELLISTILIGIIMLAIAGFNVSIKQMEASSSKQTTMAMRAMPILNQIRSDINLANGDIGGALNADNYPINQGVRVGSIAPNGEFLALRHQDKNNPPTFDRYSDDYWVIYYGIPTASKENVIVRCRQDDNNDTGWKPNINAGQSCSYKGEVSTSHVLSNNLIENLSQNPMFTIRNEGDKATSNLDGLGNTVYNHDFIGKVFVDVEMTLRYDPAFSDDYSDAYSDTYPKVSANPVYFLKTSVIPSSHSWN